MVSDQTKVKGVAPGITREKFIARLQAVGSPAASVGGLVYDYAARRSLDARFLLAMFQQESSSGTNPDAIAVSGPTHSWGNTTSPSYGDPGLGPPYVRGRFTRYADWLAGGVSTVARFFEHPPYNGKDTVREIISVWAPPGDNNNTERYISNVVATMNALGGTSMAPTIAISTGHHNKQGGDAIEITQTGPLAHEVGRACAALGLSVVYLTPDEGMGTSSASLDTIAARVCALNPLPVIYLETHTEGGGGTGVFAIYPDWGNDVDTDVRDKLGPDVARRIAAATGLGLGAHGTGVTSEKATGVGGEGFRLGIFRATEPCSADVTRLIIEYGCHDKQPDLAIARSPGFAEKCGAATAAAFADFLGWHAAPPVTPPVPDPVTQALTAWYTAQGSPQLQGNLGNDTYYEINIDWSKAGYTGLSKSARGIRGEYYAGWWNGTTVEPIHMGNWAKLVSGGGVTPRK